MRIGGRSFAFRSLLGAAPRQALAFVDELALEQWAWWQGSDRISRWWRERLEATRRLIAEVVQELPSED
jgi:hypothetical protein